MSATSISQAASAEGILTRMAGGALGRRRIAGGFVVALVAGPLLTWLLLSLRSHESITYEVLAYQLLTVIVAVVGGLLPAVLCAVLSGIALDILFVAPEFSVAVEHPLHLVALVLYVVTAVVVSVIVDQAARRASTARRAAAEAELLAAVAGHVLRGDSAVLALVERAREAFGLSGVRLVAPDGTVIARDGEPAADERSTTWPVGRAPDGGPRAVLELHGGPLDAPSLRLLDVVVTQIDAAIERAELSAAAREAESLAATDQVRSALLSAASHDLRRPLAAAVAAIGGLRSAERLADDDRAELLLTAEESLAVLSRLVTDLLDVSRAQAGVLAVALAPTDASDAVLAALEELSLGPDDVALALDPALPPLSADPVLLQRVLVNLLTNAMRFSPEGERVRVETAPFGTGGSIRVVDRGAGIPPERLDEVFQPFQRLGDTDNSAGLGLGLALSRGFAEGMGGSLTPEGTPGGGLTMRVALPFVEEGAGV